MFSWIQYKRKFAFKKQLSVGLSQAGGKLVKSLQQTCEKIVTACGCLTLLRLFTTVELIQEESLKYEFSLIFML